MTTPGKRAKGDRGVRREQHLAAISERLATWLRTKLPEAEDLRMTELRGSSEGFSNETYFFELSYRVDAVPKHERLVVRWLPSSGSLFPDQELRTQFCVMNALRDTAVPVPRLRWYEHDPVHLGTPFFVMERVDGVVPAGRLRSEGLFFDADPETRRRLWHRAVEAVADIHRLPWSELELPCLQVPGAGSDVLDRQIAECERILAWASPDRRIPVYEHALTWLKANTFTPPRVALCWGDARPGNLIYRDERVVAVLDWEMAYLGDPVADLAWFIVLEPTYAWPFGAPELEGIPGEDETVAHYERVTGSRVENLFFHKVLETLRLGVILIPHARNIVRSGIRGYPPDFETNNVATQGLDKLLSQI
ncbi:phosphotransferase family protein [Nocardia sp. NPDC005366]|uniref:phosphotransferase family protein n=1 Tax=Nocardia sp. NPDC005366 TaxID=3156878 RepID=UPI0033B6760C